MSSIRKTREVADGRRIQLHLELLEDRTLLDASFNQVYVGVLYQELLGRDVDPTGLAAWSGLLNAGVSPYSVVMEIMQSLETRTYVVQDLYQSILGRAPDPTGLAAWVNLLGSGPGMLPTLQSIMLGSSEFFTDAGGTNSGFLDSLWRHALGRGIDASGAASFGSFLAAGGQRMVAAQMVLNSGEAATTIVNNDYQGVLSRNPDPGGLAAWSQVFHDDNQAVVAGHLASPEFSGNVGAQLAAVGGLPSLPSLGDIRNAAKRIYDGLASFVQGLAAAARAVWTGLGNLKNTLVQGAQQLLLGKLTITVPANPLTFTAAEGDTTASPSQLTFAIKNTGGTVTGATAHVQGVSLVNGDPHFHITVSPKVPVDLAPGQSVTVTVTCSDPLGQFQLPSGQSAGSFSDTVRVTGNPGEAMDIGVRVNVGTKGQYLGEFLGTISENGADGNGAFSATLDGQASMTVTTSTSGGFDYSGTVTFKQSTGVNIEDFSNGGSAISFSGHVANLTGALTQFTVNLGEGMLTCNGSFSGTPSIFFGTCTYSNPGENDSDSGSGFKFNLTKQSG
jgi:hypothetical protein